MFCPNCGKALADQETICPRCGDTVPAMEELVFTPAEEPVPAAPVTEEPEAEVTESAEPAEETEAGEEAPAEEAPAEETTEEVPAEELPTEEAPKKKRSTAAIILSVVIALLVVLVVCLTIVVTTLSKTGEMPAFITNITEYFEQKSFKADATAVNVIDEEGNVFRSIDNEMLNYYFWGEFYYYVQLNGFPFDPALPLDEQAYDDTMSWQDYFMANANISLIQIEAVKAEAQEVDFVMPEEYQADYDDKINNMANYAVTAGFTNEDGTGDVLAYIQDSYGHAATVETFRQYLYDSYYVTAYSDQVYADLTLTDSEIEAYYDENAEMFASYGIEKSAVPNVNVRHILITAEAGEDGTVSDEAWAAAEAEAQRILEEWEAGDATEDTFGELANTYSTDPGSNTAGGLYTDVYPGQMVPTFNDWCFDETRKASDTGIVLSDFGYHIMYFVSHTENYYWKTVAESELRYVSYQEVLTSITSPYSTVATEELQLTSPTAVDTMAASLNSTAS